MYTSTVYFKKLHHKAYEFVRRLLSNIHGRMRKPSVPSACTYVHTRAISRKRTRFSLREAEKYTEYIAKRKTEPESLSSSLTRTPGSV